MKEKNRVGQLREKIGLTQAQLADQVGMTQQTISRVENNIFSLTADYLIILSKFFNVSADYMLELSDQKRNDEQRYRITKNMEDNQVLLENYQRLSEKHQKILVKVLNILVEEL